LHPIIHQKFLYPLTFNSVQREEIKVAILQMEGTNCEYETYLAFKELGTKPEYVHLKEIERGAKKVDDYQCIFLPGGFSAGDYVRAGAIFAARLKADVFNDLKRFVEDGGVMVGVCNGFQVLIELGFLPALNGISDEPEACLATNDSNRFECRQTLVRHEGRGCKLTSNIPEGKIGLIPSAHMEGKLVFKNDEYAQEVNEKQVVFRYVDRDGNLAGYPWNPNGSYANIAGICNNEGNVMGMMPHPERAFHKWQNPGWEGNDGRDVFEGIVGYIERKW
jgi:phosphoribosylformylglycinamidine synthase